MSKGAIMCDCDMANSDINESVVQTVKQNEVKAQRKLWMQTWRWCGIGKMFHYECNYLFTR